MAGAAARRAARALLPAVKRFAGEPDEVDRAVGRIERAGGSARFLALLGRHATRLTAVVDQRERDEYADPDAAYESGHLRLPPSLGLAMEMAVHEERERRALDGELAELERAWRDAEEIAAIAADLLLPAALTARLRR